MIVAGHEGRSILRKAKELTRGGISTIACCGCIVGNYKLSSFLAGIPLIDPIFAGFTGGLLGSVSCAIVLVLTSRMFLFLPESVFRASLKRVKDDQKIISYLGGPIHAGGFRAYSIDHANISYNTFSPSLSISKSLRSLWKPRQMQVVFQVTGSRGHGIVTAEAQRMGDLLQFNCLAVDVIDTGERIILEGEYDKDAYKGHLRVR